ncbi:hypothetical protein [Pseudoduganella sp. HUAS MS19]
MIVLPDEDGLPVALQVSAAIGDALRQSVANIEPSAAFQARLAAALDAAEQGGRPDQTPAAGGGQAAGGSGQPGEAARGAGQGSEAADVAS